MTRIESVRAFGIAALFSGFGVTLSPAIAADAGYDLASPEVRGGAVREDSDGDGTICDLKSQI